MLPFEEKFTEVRLRIKGEDFEEKNFPLADAAAMLDDETFVFVEFDNGGQISHSLLKYYYWIEKLESMPKKGYLFHVYGSEFAPDVDRCNRNFYFHRKLVSFLLGKIREIFRNFEYISSVPQLPRSGEGFRTADEAYKWLEDRFEERFSR